MEGGIHPFAFRVVLPLLWLAIVAGIAVNRRRVARRLGRDPIVIRPLQKRGTPEGTLERVLLVCALLATIDVAFNAVSPEAAARTLAIEALRSSEVLGYLGLALLFAGVATADLAIHQMGLSWRIGVDHQAPGPIVSRGLYARVRHPIYAGMLLATAGIACMTVDMLSIVVAGVAWIGVPIQARLEEQFLLSRYPEDYRRYMERTGRFLPGFWPP